MAFLRSLRRTHGGTRLGGLLVLALGLSLAGLLAPHALGQSEAASDDENVVLEGSYDNVQFLAGRSVRIRADVADDVFAAGRDVTFESATARNAIVAGYDVSLRGGSVADMIAAGANVTVAGAIEDDLVSAARSLRISSDGTVGGDARLAAETIDMEGRIGGSLRAAARRITVDGEIAGKVDLIAQRIVVTSDAKIGGDLIYRSEEDPEIAAGATIGGEVRRVEMDAPDLQSIGLALLGVGILIMVSWAIATLLLVTIVQLAFPLLTEDAAGRLWEHPWASLGLGVAGVFVASALTGALFASILGIPLGAALGMTLAVLLLLGLVTVSYCIGLFIRRWLRGPGAIGLAGRVGWALIGAVILVLVTLIPIVGGVVATLAVASGFGAAAAEIWARLRAG